ncbi:hemin uptake protein HemP [Acidovorax lacteus]|uniref:Hemin uptake protein HemP n=1 Tax=Acidovorax lacteus TaxID=1924988 RepID=A0ABP8LI60_9BURK
MQASSLAPALPLQTSAPGICDARDGSAPPCGTGNALALDSQDLLRGHKAVTIAHNGALYRLQATKLGKLILTK